METENRNDILLILCSAAVVFTAAYMIKKAYNPPKTQEPPVKPTLPTGIPNV